MWEFSAAHESSMSRLESSFIMKHRKFVLRNMWIQLNKGEKVFETIQHF
jgi:hypothetical protein